MRIKAPLTLLAAVATVLLLCADARPQDDDTPKVEVGLHYSLFRADAFEKTPAVGGRVTYNFNRHVAAEAEANVFPFEMFGPDYVTGGRPFQALAGVKAGRRFRRFGLYGKLRPGLMTFSKTVRLEPGPSFVGADGRVYGTVNFAEERKTHFTLDAGGVLEFYPSRRFVARLDVGDTIIRSGRHTEFNPDFSSTDPLLVAPASFNHNLQVSVGVGVRFGARDADDAAATKTTSGKTRVGVPRFEAGAHFTSLSFSPIRQIFGSPVGTGTPLTATELGLGGRFTYNMGAHVAAEAEVNFLPRAGGLAAGAAGRVTQGQFGVKAGRRFRRFGVFGKARPGFVSFDRSVKLVRTEPFNYFGSQYVMGFFEVGRRTFFSTDLGGVFELYPSRRFVVRFDAGDTIIRYGERHVQGFTVSQLIVSTPRETKHNFQFTSGVGFRF